MSDKVHRCTCGHVLEWHYVVGKKGTPIYGTAGRRCPSGPDCDCEGATLDGRPAARVPLLPSA